MKKIISLILINLAFFSVYAQTKNWNSELDMHSHYTKTPEATMLDRFQNYPVSNSLGIPDISIPIYVVKSGELELPITLSYHLGGNKVNDIATWVGLGWNLNVGGMISRQIKGIDDEYKGFGFLEKHTMKYMTNSGTEKSFMVPIKENEFREVKSVGINGYDQTTFYLNNIINETYDMGSDIYSYSINDLSGSFVYDMDRTLVNIPYSNNKIIRDTGNNTFKIIDPKGFIYDFSAKDEIRYPNKRVNSELTAVSNWRISKISSPYSSNSIAFTYTTPYRYEVLSRSATLSVGYLEAGEGYQGNGESYSSSRSIFYERNLSKITFDNGSIDFIASGARKDKEGNYCLDRIEIKDKQGNKIKTIVFNYGYFESGSIPSNSKNKDAYYRLKLTSLQIYGSQGGTPIEYKFSYNETKLPPRTSEDFLNITNGQDLWGFYNGVTTNKHLVGVISSSDLEEHHSLKVSKANRNSSESAMKAWILTRIDYPTGGFTEFHTEANRDKNNKVVGGLRIAKMVSKTDASSTAVTTSYKYEDPLYLTLGSDYDRPELYKYRMYIQLKNGGLLNHVRYYYTEEPYTGLFFHQGSPLYYGNVIKTETGNGKSTFSYSAPYIYRQMILNDGSSLGQINITPRYSYIENLQSWVMGKLEKEEYFKEGATTPFRTLSHKYDVLPKKRVIVGKHVYKRLKENYNSVIGAHSEAKGYYDYFWEEYETGFHRLYETTETVDGVTTKTNYTYGKANSTTTSGVQMTKKDETVNNKVINHEYKYPSDFTDGISNSMVSANMTDVMLEHTKKTGSTHIATQKRTFAKFGSFFKPSAEQSKLGNGTFNTDITYNLYDKRGNLRQYTTPDGLKTSLIWSYNGQYPVAEIRNADFNIDVKSLLGESPIDNMLNSIIMSQQESGLMNLLRASLPSSQVTTYTYTPLIGVSTVTSPSGITSFYDYDQYGRLMKVYLKEGNKENILNTYSYQYKDGAGESLSSFVASNPNVNISKEIQSVTIPQSTSGYKAPTTFTANVEGGSGYYDYEWSIGGVVKKIGASYTHTAENANSFNLTCKVTDQIFKTTKTVTSTIKIAPYILKFENRQWSEDSSTKIGTLKAKVWSPVKTTLTVKTIFNRASSRYETIKATFYLPPYWREVNDTCGNECIHEQQITLNAGDNYVTIQIFKGTNMYQGSSRAEMILVSASGTNVTANQDVLSLIY